MDVGGVQVLGKLSVDRNSMTRILFENPEFVDSQALTGLRSEDEACNEARKEDGVCAFVDA